MSAPWFRRWCGVSNYYTLSMHVPRAKQFGLLEWLANLILFPFLVASTTNSARARVTPLKHTWYMYQWHIRSTHHHWDWTESYTCTCHTPSLSVQLHPEILSGLLKNVKESNRHKKTTCTATCTVTYGGMILSHLSTVLCNKLILFDSFLGKAAPTSNFRWGHQ